jgi:transposase
MMAKALSNDLRLRILKASAAGMSARQAAARFRGGGIECDPVDRAGEDRRIDPRRQGSHRASSLDPHEGFIVGLIDERKDITLNEMVERLKGERSVRISRSALSACLGRHDILKRRQAWFDDQPDLDPAVSSSLTRVANTRRDEFFCGYHVRGYREWCWPSYISC